ncbi:MAG TPA: error-prone DNA polymerase, partial [Polyangiaceae bacterium]|nr:error-prone DNA polymerase [Polyangiaceae bacterium]
AVPTVALLVQDARGYQNLCHLLTRAHAGLPKGEAVLELEQLAAHHEGLLAIVPVPGFGLTGRAAVQALSLPKRGSTRADVNPGSGTLEDTVFDLETLVALKGIFSDRLFLAAYRRLDGLDAVRQQWLSRARRALNVEIVASARPTFHVAERKALADVLHCIRTGSTLSEAADRLQINAEARLRSGAELERLFRDTPQWLERAAELARSCNFDLKQLRYEFPCTLPPEVSADEHLQTLTWQAARRRYGDCIPKEIRGQLEKELAIIRQLKVSPYFLSTLEIVEIAREKRILCQGRGSAANSAVCYVLGITAVDPGRHSLLFERFISPERHEPPDIDVDFEHERREEVIQEIYSRYGRDKAAMVSEVICYRGKSALREVGKVFGLSLEQIDKLSSALTHWDGVDEGKKHLNELGFDPQNDTLRQVLQLARELQGFPRHLSIHVGGFVLSARPLYEVAPIEPARREGRTVVPWDKDDIEALGFFKVDVLGLGMLTAIRKALALIHPFDSPFDGAQGSLRAEPLDSPSFDPIEALARVPVEDPAAYALACVADTVGVFQIESRAQMAMLPRLRPQCFYDLVIEVAIVRPGPIQGGMVHPYLRRRNGEESSKAPHEILDPILERTLGVPLFQEQVMQLAIVGAGYSGGEADQLRRDMAAWKRSGKLLRHRDRLIEGFAKNGIQQEFAERLFEQIKGFGDYGFPESHAASFALLVYTSLWLKAHHLAAFACSLINSQPMGFYSPRVILRDAEHHGVLIKPLHVNHSQWDCSLEQCSQQQCGRQQCSHQQGALRVGFRLLKGFSREATTRIVEARKKEFFTSVDDFVWRTGLPREQLEALAEAGAFAELLESRREVLWQLRAPRVTGLFAGKTVKEPAIQLRKLQKLETLLLDYRRTGVSLDDHPLLHLRPQLERQQVVQARDLVHMKTGDRVKVAGLVQSRQRPGTASGIVFITLEDETGVSNLVLYSHVFEENRRVARGAMLLCAEGKVELQLTTARADDRVRESTPVIHVIVEKLGRLELGQGEIPFGSRDFH